VAVNTDNEINRAWGGVSSQHLLDRAFFKTMIDGKVDDAFENMFAYVMSLRWKGLHNPFGGLSGVRMRREGNEIIFRMGEGTEIAMKVEFTTEWRTLPYQS